MRLFTVRYTSELFGIVGALWGEYSSHEAAAQVSADLQAALRKGGYPRMASSVHVE
jgi:hypothetical protein